jgi:hypothetical protein
MVDGLVKTIGPRERDAQVCMHVDRVRTAPQQPRS